jgi:hypothetical protein
MAAGMRFDHQCKMSQKSIIAVIMRNLKSTLSMLLQPAPPSFCRYGFQGVPSFISPYLPIYFSQLGFTGAQIGLLSALRPWISAPFGMFHVLADSVHFIIHFAICHAVLLVFFVKQRSSLDQTDIFRRGF